MAVHNLLVKAYGVNIYKYGNRTFSTIPVDYHDPVKMHVADTYTLSDIDKALVEQYITQEEYDATLSFTKTQTNAE